MKKVQYRITTTLTQKFVVEGEAELAFAEDRVEQLASGYINEADHEVSSYRSFKPRPVLEILVDEDNDVWVEVMPEAQVVG